MQNKIRELRKEKNMTLSELANVIGVSAVTISRYENGEREPSLRTLKKLADYFDVPVDYLVGIIDDSEFKELREQKKYLENNKEWIEQNFDILTILLAQGAPDSEIEFTNKIDTKQKENMIFLLGLLFLKIGNNFSVGSSDFYNQLLHFSMSYSRFSE